MWRRLPTMNPTKKRGISRGRSETLTGSRRTTCLVLTMTTMWKTTAIQT